MTSSKPLSKKPFVQKLIAITRMQLFIPVLALLILVLFSTRMSMPIPFVLRQNFFSTVLTRIRLCFVFSERLVLHVFGWKEKSIQIFIIIITAGLL